MLKLKDYRELAKARQWEKRKVTDADIINEIQSRYLEYLIENQLSDKPHLLFFETEEGVKRVRICLDNTDK